MPKCELCGNEIASNKTKKSDILLCEECIEALNFAESPEQEQKTR